MSFSHYLEDALLDVLFDQAVWYPPWISVGLSRADPGKDEYGLDEPDWGGSGYERVLTYSYDWSYSLDSEIINGVEIVFPVADGDWGLITYFALFDEDNNGVMLLYAELDDYMQVSIAHRVSFLAGELKVGLY